MVTREVTAAANRHNRQSMGRIQRRKDSAPDASQTTVERQRVFAASVGNSEGPQPTRSLVAIASPRTHRTSKKTRWEFQSTASRLWP